MNSETKTGKCIIFSAPSGAGKTTVVKELLNKNDLKLEFSISATTRLPRGSEINGKEYYFLSIDEFKSAIEKNAFVEWEEVYENNFYGTLKSELDRIWLKGNQVIFDVDVKGGINLKHNFGENALSIFIQPPSLNVLEQRLRNRGTDSEEKIKQRLAKAEYELSFASQFDKKITNNLLNESIAEAEKIIHQFLLQ